jgi:hypothetical protein
MSTANYLTQAINGSVRIAFVIAPSFKAGSHLLELASRGLNAALGVIGIQLKMPDVSAQVKKDESYATKAYRFVHHYLPNAITTQNDAFRGLSSADLAKGFVWYTGVAVVSTFVLNKLIGPAPEIYNTVAKYSGNALRMDLKYDVVQLAINSVKGS